MPRYSEGTVSVTQGDTTAYGVFQTTVTGVAGTYSASAALTFPNTGATGSVVSYNAGSGELKFTINSTAQPAVGESVRTATATGTLFLFDFEPAFNTNVVQGSVFTADVTAPVSYIISSIPTKSRVTLTAPYGGSTLTDSEYQITNSFTPNFGIPYAEPGDQNPTSIFKLGIIELDELVHTLSVSGTVVSGAAGPPGPQGEPGDIQSNSDAVISGTWTFRENLTVENEANSTLRLTIDSGNTAPQSSDVELADRGSVKWIVGKNSLNNFFVYDEVRDVTPIFVASGTGSATDGALSISTNGLVGVGTFSPVEKLHVAGSGVVTGKVGIGTTTIAGSAILDVTSTAGGFLPPRMTNTQKNSIASPTAGLMVWNTTSGTVDVYTGTHWRSLAF